MEIRALDAQIMAAIGSACQKVGAEREWRNRMGKIYQNKWAGYETYFTPTHPVRTREFESDAIGGYQITNVDGKWKCRKGQYYTHTIHDEEHFPVVGEVKINVLGYVMDAMLNALGMKGEQE